MFKKSEHRIRYIALSLWRDCEYSVNKHQGIRAGLVWDKQIAHLIRQHNNANVIVLPARFITNDQAVEFVEEFLATDFEGGRHQRRIEKIPVKACSRQ